MGKVLRVRDGINRGQQQTTARHQGRNTHDGNPLSGPPKVGDLPYVCFARFAWTRIIAILYQVICRCRTWVLCRLLLVLGAQDMSPP